MNAPEPQDDSKPELMDFWTKAEEDPATALDLLVWLFMDEELVRNRFQFLSALIASVEDRHVEVNVEEFAQEIEMIREHGVFHAVKDHGVELQRLCRMAGSPATLVATYEAFTGEKMVFA